MLDKKTVRSMLLVGDLRSADKAAEVVELIKLQPTKANILVDCLSDDDASVRMRAADALEKISREHASLLQRYKRHLLLLLAEAKQKAVRWHLAVTIPRLKLTAADRRQAAIVLQAYLQDRSSIVKTFAMQGLSDLTRHDAELRRMVLELIRDLSRTGTAAMRARGRILLRTLEKA